MQKILNMFPFVVTMVLLAFAGVFRSPAFAYASVLVLALIAAQSYSSEVMANKTYKAQIPEDVRKKMDDLSNRVMAIELEKQRRGF